MYVFGAFSWTARTALVRVSPNVLSCVTIGLGETRVPQGSVMQMLNIVVSRLRSSNPAVRVTRSVSRLTASICAGSFFLVAEVLKELVSDLVVAPVQLTSTTFTTRSAFATC